MRIKVEDDGIHVVTDFLERVRTRIDEFGDYDEESQTVKLTPKQFRKWLVRWLAVNLGYEEWLLNDIADWTLLAKPSFREDRKLAVSILKRIHGGEMSPEGANLRLRGLLEANVPGYMSVLTAIISAHNELEPLMKQLTKRVEAYSL